MKENNFCNYCKKPIHDLSLESVAYDCYHCDFAIVHAELAKKESK